MNEYVTSVRELKDNFLFKSKFVGDEQKNVAEGDILRDIQEVWEAATEVATCGVTFAEVKTVTATMEEIATRAATKFLEAVTTALLAATEIGSSSSG